MTRRTSNLSEVLHLYSEERIKRLECGNNIRFQGSLHINTIPHDNHQLYKSGHEEVCMLVSSYLVK